MGRRHARHLGSHVPRMAAVLCKHRVVGSIPTGSTGRPGPSATAPARTDSPSWRRPGRTHSPENGGIGPGNKQDPLSERLRPGRARRIRERARCSALPRFLCRMPAIRRLRAAVALTEGATRLSIGERRRFDSGQRHCDTRSTRCRPRRVTVRAASRRGSEAETLPAMGLYAAAAGNLKVRTEGIPRKSASTRVPSSWTAEAVTAGRTTCASRNRVGAPQRRTANGARTAPEADCGGAVRPGPRWSGLSVATDGVWRRW